MASRREPRFTHLDAEGQAAMVDVSGKAVSQRTATARCSVLMQPETIALIVRGAVKKGDVLSVARLAGIMGAKRTAELIPLCHPLNPNVIEVNLAVDEGRHAVDVEATVKVDGKTGVEMEALTAASVAALTIYDMVKSVDRGTTITDLRLVHKAGGKSGEFRAD